MFQIYRLKLVLIYFAIFAVPLGTYSFLNHHPQLPTLPPGYQPYISAALDRAGGNRAELVRALAKVDSERLPGLCNVICRMPQNDLVNVRASELLENINSAYEINQKVPWKLDPKSELFLSYVLPQRVGYEPLLFSRPRVFKLFKSRLQACNTQEEALLEAAFFFKEYDYLGTQSVYPFDIPPFTGMEDQPYHWKGWGCQYQAVFFTAVLRAIGIPARIITPPGYLAFGANHRAIDYYNVRDGKWHAVNPAELVMTLNLARGESGLIRECDRNGIGAYYAYPPYIYGDLLHQQLYESMQDQAPRLYPCGSVFVHVSSKNKPIKNARVCIYSWNKFWHLIKRTFTDSNGDAAFSVGETKGRFPYMVNASDGRLCAQTGASVEPNQSIRLNLDLAAPKNPTQIDPILFPNSYTRSLVVKK